VILEGDEVETEPLTELRQLDRTVRRELAGEMNVAKRRG